MLQSGRLLSAELASARPKAPAYICCQFVEMSNALTAKIRRVFKGAHVRLQNEQHRNDSNADACNSGPGQRFFPEEMGREIVEQND